MKKINTVEEFIKVAEELSDEQMQVLENVRDRLEEEKNITLSIKLVFAAMLCQPEHARAEDNIHFSAEEIIEEFPECFGEPNMLTIDDYIKREITEGDSMSAYHFGRVLGIDLATYVLHDAASIAAVDTGYYRQLLWQDFDYYTDHYIGDYLITKSEFGTYGDACDRFIECLHAYERDYGGEFEGCESIADFKSRARELGYLDEYASYIIAFKIVKQMLGNVALPFESCTVDEFAFKCLALEDALTGTIAEIEKQL